MAATTVRGTSHDRLLSLQRRIFRSLQAEADRLLGPTPQPILDYEREYEKDFRGSATSFRPLRKDNLIRAIRGAEVTFVADFHTFHQAQRTALRLMRDSIRPGEQWYVGLELIPTQFQKILDDFQAGNLTVEAFHRKIHYQEEWGFPWSNYEPIFEWARSQGVKLVALNRPKELFRSSASFRRVKKDSELHDRDLWSAGVITDIFADALAAGQKPRMIVLYGELHVATRHLPAHLTRVSRACVGRPLRYVCIHQNNDGLYWKLARQGKEHHVHVLRLKKDVYCVLSSTPWTRLQSLISWAEGSPPPSDETSVADDEIESESGGIDYLATIQTCGNAVAEFLGVPRPSYEALTVRTINEADFIDSLEREHLFSHRELQIIRHHVANNQRLYIPRASIAYLGSPSLNSAAELAAIHLQRLRTRSQEILNPDPDDFFRLTIEAAFGFFGSLIINPRRKCDLPEDHVRRLRSLRRQEEAKPLSANEREEADARHLTLLVLRAQRKLLAAGRTHGASPLLVPELGESMGVWSRAPVVMSTARFLGQMVGKKLHHALLAEAVSPETVRHLCLARADGARRPFEERYVDLLRACAGARLAGTKTEAL